MEALPGYALLPNKVHIATSNQDTYIQITQKLLPIQILWLKSEERKQNDVVNTAFVNSFFQILARIPWQYFYKKNDLKGCFARIVWGNLL